MNLYGHIRFHIEITLKVERTKKNINFLSSKEIKTVNARSDDLIEQILFDLKLFFSSLKNQNIFSSIEFHFFFPYFVHSELVSFTLLQFSSPPCEFITWDETSNDKNAIKLYNLLAATSWKNLQNEEKEKVNCFPLHN